MMFVYILECADSSFYTGVTNNLTRRLTEHQHGVERGCYTYTRRPVNLVFHEIFPDAQQAISWEKQIKGWSRRKKKALIEGDWEKLQEFARCINDTSHKNKNK